MSSPMQKVSSLVSSQLGNTLSSIRTWGNIIINIRDLGAKGNGTDETSILNYGLNLAASLHSILLIPKGMTLTVNGLINIQNKNNFGIDVQGVIKRINNSTVLGPILTLTNCTDVKIYEINFDGNALNNGCVENKAYTVAQEQNHTLSILGCSRIQIESFYVLNPCGDGIYISNQSNGIEMKSVSGKADTQIGRNLVSIISAENVYIDTLFNDNIGHFDMPGGFDIEPNKSTEIVRNVYVSNIMMKCGGTNPLSVLASNGSLVENINIGSATITRTNVVPIGSSSSSIIISGSNVNIDNLVVINETIYDITFLTINTYTASDRTAKNINIINAYTKNTYRGLNLGFNFGVEDIYIKAIMKDLKNDGIIINNGKNISLYVDINSVGASRFMLNKASGGPVENLKLSGNISKRGTGTRAIISNDLASNIINWTFENLDFTGWNPGERVVGTGMSGSVTKINCKNLTYNSVAPTADQWNKNDIVYNNNATAGGYIGFVCVVSGTPGTWKGFGAVQT